MYCFSSGTGVCLGHCIIFCLLLEAPQVMADAMQLKPNWSIAITSRRPLKNTFFFGGWGSLSSFVDDNLRQPPKKKVVVRGRRLAVAIV